MPDSARHKGKPEKIGWLRIGIVAAFAIFIIVCFAGAYNAWWISAHCTTILGTLVC